MDLIQDYSEPGTEEVTPSVSSSSRSILHGTNELISPQQLQYTVMEESPNPNSSEVSQNLLSTIEMNLQTIEMMTEENINPQLNFQLNAIKNQSSTSSPPRSYDSLQQVADYLNPVK